MIGSIVGRNGNANALRRRRPSRFLRWIAGFVAVVIVGAGLGMLALMVLLSQGPMRVDAIGQRIASSLDARAGDRYAFDLGATYLTRSNFGPALVIDGFRMKSGMQTIVAAPRAEVSIDPLAMLAGDMRPRRLQVSNIDINLVVLPDGSISVASGQEAAPIPVTPAPTATAKVTRAVLLAKAGTALRTFFDFATQPGGAIGAVERIEIRSGRLVVEDKTTDRRIVFEELEVAFNKSHRATDLVITARGPNGPMSGEAHAQGIPGEMRTLTLGVRDLSIDEMILSGGVRRPVFDSDMKIAANANFALDPSGAVREASASFGMGAGYIRLEDPDHEPYFIDEMSGSLHWDVTARRIVLDPTHLFAADTRLTMVGTIDPPADNDEDWKVALRLAEPGAIAGERPGERVLPITEFAVEGRVLPYSQRAVLDRALFKGPDIDLSVTGTTQWDDGLHVKFNGKAGQGPLRPLLRIWPSHVGAGMRRWLLGHTHGGMVRGATMTADFDRHSLLMMRYNRPPPDDKLTMDFNIVGGSVDTLQGLAPITELDANVRVTGRTLLLAAKSGVLEVSPGRRLALLGGSLDMPRNDGSDAVPARIELRTSGPVEAAAEILTKDAMRGVAQLPIDPGTLHGKIEGRVTADFEIGAQALASRSVVGVNLNATDFSVDRIIGKEKLEGATVNLVNDVAGFRATGTGRLFGGPATFELRRPNGQPTVATANVTFDDAARARAGYALTGVSGPIGAKISATIGDTTKAQIDLDLTRAGIENGIPGLVKPAGKPGRLAFTLDQKGNALFLDQVNFESAGAAARGVIELTTDGGFQSARFSQMRLSPGDDFRADITKNGDGIRIAVKAVNFDARPFLKFVTQPGNATPGTGGDFDLELKAPIVTGFGKQAMSNVDLRLVRRASTIRLFTLNGGFGRKPIVASMSRDGGSTPQVNIATPDAGALFAFTDLYQRMEGGALSTLLQMESGRITGTVLVQNFVLKDEPALRRLVIEGVPQQVSQNGKPQLRSETVAIPFERLSGVFTHANGRIDIRDGLMNGQILGLTVEGSVDDARDTLNLTGTYVPAYGINNLFSKIPLFGVFLGGGWNEGLFAVNFHITGRPSAPVLSINPLSAVAPGFLRKLFGAIDGTGSQSPSFPQADFPTATRGSARGRPITPSPGPVDPSGQPSQ